MLGGVPSSLTTSGEAGAAHVLVSSSLPAGGGGGGGGAEDTDRIGGTGGNRWPRDETVALLQIRSDMDVAFRDSSLKGPLWEQVSRKMAELGFQRSAKKCKEKFENVYKYHKRTKDGRRSKSDGKTYRFFDQLEAFETAPPSRAQIQPQSSAPPLPTTAGVSGTAFPANSPPNFQQFNPHAPPPPPIPNFLTESDSTSSTSSDEDIQRRRRLRGKKRKWKEFFQGLMRDVIEKQEQLQKKFLETLETREREQMAREEAWRAQELARMNREQEILAQERSAAAAKDAAVISFLQKIADQHNLQFPIITAPPPPPPPQPNPPVQPQRQNQRPPPPPPPPPIAAPPLSTLIPIEIQRGCDSPSSAGGSGGGPSSSRWPKSEIQALIQLRMNLEMKYQEGGPKGPLWEEISAAMDKLGFRRSAKRCKEKWENINKYFKKVKESNKKRPEDSKTCPYYHLLDAIYKEKAKHEMPPQPPIMALPEQQWPTDSSTMPANRDHNQVHDGTENFDNFEDEDEDDQVEHNNDEVGGDYEMVANAPRTLSPPPAAASEP